MNQVMLSKTWLPLIMPLELQGGVPHLELDCEKSFGSS
jgi:hypothetical protein